MKSLAHILPQKLLAILMVLIATPLLLLSTACDDDETQSLTVYSGRSADLIEPLLNQFAEESGIDISVRYGKTAAMAALILEEGEKSPADVFIAQDAGALGTIEAKGLLATLDTALLEQIPTSYRSANGEWIGLSGRARVIVYNTDALSPEDLPESILDFTDPAWNGRLGWAPTNGSFQAWLTALRLSEGEEGARSWLEGIKANGVIEYPKNTPIVDAVGRGEIDVGFVNHYYLHRFLAEEGDSFAARNYYTAPGDIGTLVNVAGAGILSSSENQNTAIELLEFMLSDTAQRYYSETTYEYPLVNSVASNADLPSISNLQPPTINLSELSDLEGTLKLLRSVGVLP